jgi:hypothetical protein
MDEARRVNERERANQWSRREPSDIDGKAARRSERVKN